MLIRVIDKKLILRDKLLHNKWWNELSNLNKCKASSILLFSLILLTVCVPLSAEIKGLWITAWDFTTPEKIDEAVQFAIDNNFTQLFVQVRYRGDALYQPNRIFDTYPNSEPVSYLLADPDFDPLAYILNSTIAAGIEVHAWVTVFVVTPRELKNLSPNHLLYTKPDWITKDFMGKKMETGSYEGAYLDPGIPDVQDYLLDVFRDIVVNYNVKGLHLDYVRYPDNQFGYAEEAMNNYTDSIYKGEFHLWKEEQINRFIRRCYSEIKQLNPQLIYTTAVVSNLYRARNRYSQNWTQWLEEGIIDYAYIMAYGLTDDVIDRELQDLKPFKDRIIVGLRAWSEVNRPYKADDIETKVLLSRVHNYPGIALFSYGGVRGLMNNSLNRMLDTTNTPAVSGSNTLVYGYVKGNQGEALGNILVKLNGEKETFTDSNGFYFFSQLSSGNYWVKAETGLRVFISDTITISSTPDVDIEKYDIQFPVFDRDKDITEDNDYD